MGENLLCANLLTDCSNQLKISILLSTAINYLHFNNTYFEEKTMHTSVFKKLSTIFIENEQVL